MVYNLILDKDKDKNILCLYLIIIKSIRLIVLNLKENDFHFLFDN